MRSKKIHLTVLWIILASGLMLTAIWQAQVAAARDAKARHAGPSAPLKTKSDRAPLPSFTGDPVADYLSRSVSGMTDQEILWICEDFRQTGMEVAWRFSDKTTDPEIIAVRYLQQKWYLHALTDGLRLNPEQKREASAKLARLARTVHEDMTLHREKPTHPPLAHPVTRFDAILPHLWIFSTPANACQPWNLCTLDSGQESITWKAPPPGAVAAGNPELRVSAASQTGDAVPEWARLVNAILPITRQQKPLAEELPEAPEKLLENIRHLHPAQFKLLLLFHGEYAPVLLEALAADRKPDH